jgi:GNAT superfamily N-acetyltransferase
MEILFSPTLDSDLRKIFWNVFFEMKQRGISLSRHFPWIENPAGDAIFIRAIESARAAGGLVLRTRHMTVNGRAIKIGMIGLVCVREEDRGRGISKLLLLAAIEYARKEQFDYLTLWTSQHAIYEKFGFHTHDQWLYGTVGVESEPTAIETEAAYRAIFTEDESLPLPPYASKSYSYSDGEISIVLLEDAKGVIVADYQGNARKVARFLSLHLPAQWRLNITANDLLLSELTLLEINHTLVAVNLQMWLTVNESAAVMPFAENIIIPLLDRI